MEDSELIKEYLTILYELTIDKDTGEIISTKIVNKRQDPINEDTGVAMAYLLENNIQLNKTAADLMKISADFRISLKYENIDGITRPVFGTDEAFGTKGGNRVTKGLTISCRGTKNEELSKYGGSFRIEPHPYDSGLFVLISTTEDINKEEEKKIEKKEEKKVKDNVEDKVEDNIEDLPFDLNLDNATEVDPSIFEF